MRSKFIPRQNYMYIHSCLKLLRPRHRKNCHVQAILPGKIGSRSHVQFGITTSKTYALHVQERVIVHTNIRLHVQVEKLP